MYEARVLPRRSVTTIVVGAGVAAVVGFASIGNAGFSDAFFRASFITLFAIAGGVGLVIALLMPTRLEVDDHEIRLIARRATTRYRPDDMAIVRRPDETYSLVRRKTGRTLAIFRPSDHVEAEAAFSAAGAHIGPEHIGPET
jgi:hypothetical protein